MNTLNYMTRTLATAIENQKNKKRVITDYSSVIPVVPPVVSSQTIVSVPPLLTTAALAKF